MPKRRFQFCNLHSDKSVSFAKTFVPSSQSFGEYLFHQVTFLCLSTSAFFSESLQTLFLRIRNHWFCCPGFTMQTVVILLANFLSAFGNFLESSPAQRVLSIVSCQIKCLISQGLISESRDMCFPKFLGIILILCPFLLKVRPFSRVLYCLYSLFRFSCCGNTFQTEFQFSR